MRGSGTAEMGRVVACPAKWHFAFFEMNGDGQDPGSVGRPNARILTWDNEPPGGTNSIIRVHS
jgi:hypothetical protein